MTTATLTSKGQITLPKEIREQLGLKAGVRFECYVDRDGHTTGRLPLASLAGVTGGRYFSVLRPEIEEALREP